VEGFNITVEGSSKTVEDSGKTVEEGFNKTVEGSSKTVEGSCYTLKWFYENAPVSIKISTSLPGKTSTNPGLLSCNFISEVLWILHSIVYLNFLSNVSYCSPKLS
jgi:hypothetical protein